MKLTTLKSPLAELKSSIETLGSWRAKRQSSTARGYGYKWQQERKKFLAEHPLCEMCAATGHTAPATVVDHKHPHRGNQDLFWDQSNWLALCVRHHNRDAQRRDRAL